VTGVDAISFDDFVAELERYFVADQVSRDQARALYDRWREIAGDPARVLGLRDLLRGDAMASAHGDAWYEAIADRDQASPADLVHLVVASDASMPPTPLPRPHCPARLVGQWQLEASAEDGRTFEPPRRPLAWLLTADGTIGAAGEPIDGARWGLHEGAPAVLVVRQGHAARRWVISAHDPRRLDLIPPGSTHRTLRFHRLDRPPR